MRMHARSRQLIKNERSAPKNIRQHSPIEEGVQIMKQAVKTLCATLIASVAFVGVPGAHAQDQASAGACLAAQNTLNVPVLVMIESTNGINPNGDMTLLQINEIGHQDYPWIIQPGRAQTLIFSPDEGSGYVVSQNGNFIINAQAIRPGTQAGIAAQIQTWSGLKATWDFHPEMTEGGACKGTWVARF